MKRIIMIVFFFFSLHTVKGQDSFLVSVEDEKTGMIGFINLQGEFVIKPQFKEAGSFINGYTIAQAYENREAWLIDSKGKRVIKLGGGRSVFNSTSDGILLIVDFLSDTSFRISLVDKSLKPFSNFILYQSQYPAFFIHDAPPLTIHDSAILLKNKFGFSFIDYHGKTFYKYYSAKEIRWNSPGGSDFYIENFSEGLAYFRIGNEIGYINKKGKRELVMKNTSEYKYESSSFDNGIAILSEKNIKSNNTIFYFLKKDGSRAKIIEDIEWVQKPYDPGGNLVYRNFNKKGLFLARDANTQLYGYLNSKGFWQIKPIYKKASLFFDNSYAPVLDLVTNKWGYINESGEIVNENFNFQYDEAHPFVNGYSFFKVDESSSYYGVIDKSGAHLLTNSWKITWHQKAYGFGSTIMGK